MNNLINHFQDISNHFKEDELTFVDTGEVMISDNWQFIRNE